MPDEPVPSGLTHRQLALPFAHVSGHRREDFLAAGSNAQARHLLVHPHTWPNARLAVWGSEGCGKSHLAHLWAQDHGVLLAGACLTMDLPEARAYAIDDADTCADEPILLHVLNICAEARRPVLLTGRSPPARWPNRLPDLVSRLRAMLAVQIETPEDSLLRALLSRQLAERQLVVAEAVQDFLIIRLPRTAAAMRAIAAALDRLSLERRRPITRDLAAHAIVATHSDDVSMSSTAPPPPFSPKPSRYEPTLL